MGVLEPVAGAEQHNITGAAPNELKLGEGGQSDKSWPSARRWRRGAFVRRRLRNQHRRFGVLVFRVQADTHTFRKPAQEGFRS